ncbi:hypothetical protein T265_02586 [Opisthorchis viverrini]|uniref:Uncharacterized protein n=1 Tax=Opisthorchis viverrini TaxID=6198 RepID=A0A074ZVJ0_OPIVI|nr:hypothetical protein T265_02586 [Opisthorchis viverrini]KER31141.1 hypothetical protein T265_02586 [Opisthorchis viverrini]
MYRAKLTRETKKSPYYLQLAHVFRICALSVNGQTFTTAQSVAKTSKYIQKLELTASVDYHLARPQRTPSTRSPLDMAIRNKIGKELPARISNSTYRPHAQTGGLVAGQRIRTARKLHIRLTSETDSCESGMLDVINLQNNTNNSQTKVTYKQTGTTVQ